MTILHVTDLHFSKNWFDWLRHSAPAHDVLVISGDLLDLAHPAFPAEQVRWVSDWVRDYPHPLCICSGNHDEMWDDRNDRWSPAHWIKELGSDNVLTDDQVRNIGGIRFAAHSSRSHQYTPSDVAIMHVPPARLAISRTVQGRDCGDPDSPVLDCVPSPSLVLTGHVHNAIGWNDTARDSVFVNPGFNRAGRFPNHVLIDLEQGSLVHTHDSIGGARSAAWQTSLLALRASTPPLI